jgi:hypothetical protein
MGTAIFRIPPSVRDGLGPFSKIKVIFSPFWLWLFRGYYTTFPCNVFNFSLQLTLPPFKCRSFLHFKIHTFCYTSKYIYLLCTLLREHVDICSYITRPSFIFHIQLITHSSGVIFYRAKFQSSLPKPFINSTYLFLS